MLGTETNGKGKPMKTLEIVLFIFYVLVFAAAAVATACAPHHPIVGF
jgi:hypothetical protein